MNENPPSFWLMVALGVVLLVISCFLCAGARSLVPFFISAAAAFPSLFFKGYRGLFVGFAGAIGLAYLALIAICGALGNPHF